MEEVILIVRSITLMVFEAKTLLLTTTTVNARKKDANSLITYSTVNLHISICQQHTSLSIATWVLKKK
jgi:hypothetical protein